MCMWRDIRCFQCKNSNISWMDVFDYYQQIDDVKTAIFPFDFEVDYLFGTELWN